MSLNFIYNKWVKECFLGNNFFYNIWKLNYNKLFDWINDVFLGNI